MSLERDIHEEQVSQFNLTGFTLVEIGSSVKTVVEKMRAENQHCALIIEKGELVGIFTDWDVLHQVVDDRATWELPIDDVMTSTPMSVNLNQRADMALALMDYKRLRNVPVLRDNGVLVGNLTHEALIQYLAHYLFPAEFPDTGASTDPSKSWFFGV